MVATPIQASSVPVASDNGDHPHCPRAAGGAPNQRISIAAVADELVSRSRAAAAAILTAVVPEKIPSSSSVEPPVLPAVLVTQDKEMVIDHKGKSTYNPQSYS